MMDAPLKKGRFTRLREKPKMIVSRVKSEARFLKNWADSPLRTGAIAPSGQSLARRMASYVPANPTLPVLEIGPGTGSVTEALLKGHVEPDQLVALEYSEDFCNHLRRRFPNIAVIQGDAYALNKTLTDYFATVPKFSAIVSSLPLLNSPKPQRNTLLNEALDLLAPNAPFIQFSYGLIPPIEPPQGVVMRKTRWILRNIPPARVYVYRRA